MTPTKLVVADQETLTTQINTYIHGLQQKLEEVRVTTTDDALTVRRAQGLVDQADKRTVKVLDAAVKRVSRDGVKEKAKLQRQIRTLYKAIEIIEQNSDLVRPNQFRARWAILECMYQATGAVSAKQVIEYLALCGLLIDRRRLSVRFSYMKKQGVIKNTKHARWTITPAGREELRERQKD